MWKLCRKFSEHKKGLRAWLGHSASASDGKKGCNKCKINAPAPLKAASPAIKQAKGRQRRQQLRHQQCNLYCVGADSFSSRSIIGILFISHIPPVWPPTFSVSHGPSKKLRKKWTEKKVSALVSFTWRIRSVYVMRGTWPGNRPSRRVSRRGVDHLMHDYL